MLFCQEFFVAVYALLCGEKLRQKLCLWRKKDKYHVCVSCLLVENLSSVSPFPAFPSPNFSSRTKAFTCSFNLCPANSEKHMGRHRYGITAWKSTWVSIKDYTWREGTLVKGNEKAHEQSWTVDNDNNSK